MSYDAIDSGRLAFAKQSLHRPGMCSVLRKANRQKQGNRETEKERVAEEGGGGEGEEINSETKRARVRASRFAFKLGHGPSFQWWRARH